MRLDDTSFLSSVIHLEPDNFTQQMWGGDWIARFKGLAPPRGPVGESWDFSARTERPSLARLANGQRVPLPDLIKAFPKEILGARIFQRYGPTAPILIKFIDAKDDLSLQVHPSDEHTEMPESAGKSEAWFVLESGRAEGEGYIYIGFDPKKAAGYPDEETFENAFFEALNQANAQGPSNDANVRKKGERLVLSFLNKVRVKPGEVYELKPGTIHAIGRGVRLFEVQQSSDLTYRVWDWNRPDAEKSKQGKLSFRELHLEKARTVLDFQAAEPETYRLARQPLKAIGEGKFSEELLVVDQKKNFAATLLTLSEKNSSIRVPTNNAFQVLTVIKGSIEAGSEVKQGHSVLVPASLESIALRARQTPTHIIRSYVPI